MRRMTEVLVVTLALAGGALAQQKKQPEIDLQAAIRTETVSGDLKGAIKQFESILAKYGSDRSLTAKALVHMAECYEKLGASESRKIYERVVREYADQAESSEQARKRLATLNGAQVSGTLVKRLLCDRCGDNENDISPDGRWMAMTEWDESGDLAVKDMSTGQIKRMMAKTGTWKTSQTYVETPVFSPDLREIAYLFWTGDKESGAQLRVMPNEAGGKHRVLLDTRENNYYEIAGWSPDGQSILTILNKPDRTWQLAWVSASDGTVRVLKSLEWRLMNIGRARPSLSPDGRYVAYTALAVNPKSAAQPPESKDQRIYIIASDGSSETVLVKTAGINRNPVWTPDGKHILFTSDCSGSFGLWSVAVQNGRAAGAPTLVTPEIGNINTIGITQSGAYYYTIHQRLEMAGVIDMARPSHVRESLIGIGPVWSPDGKMLAFTRRSGPASADTYDLVVQLTESGEEAVYTFPGIRPSPLKWMNDGKGVLVNARNQSNTLGWWFRVDLKTREFKQVFEYNPKEVFGGITAISQDDKTLYVAGRKPGIPQVDRIVAVELSTGQKRDIAVPATGLIHFKLSPDGRTLAIRREDREANSIHYATVAVDGSGYREVHTAHILAGDGIGRFDILEWTRDGRGLLFEVRRDEAWWRLMRLPLDAGNPEFTGMQAKGTLLSISLSPDGSQLAYSSTPKISEFWALDNVLAALK